MDYGEELSDIIGRLLERAYAEEFTAGREFDTAIFHSAGIALAGCVDRPAIEVYFGE